jgi:hypothetical protein
MHVYFRELKLLECVPETNISKVQVVTFVAKEMLIFNVNLEKQFIDKIPKKIPTVFLITDFFPF